MVVLKMQKNEVLACISIFGCVPPAVNAKDPNLLKIGKNKIEQTQVPLIFMISTPDRQALLALSDKFINSGEDVTLAHLLDLVNSTILDHESEDFREWSKYMEKLNETWVLINKENEQIPWPEVRKYPQFFDFCLTLA